MVDWNSNLIKFLVTLLPSLLLSKNLTKITIQVRHFANTYYLTTWFIDILEIETDNLPIESGPEQTNLERFVCLQFDNFPSNMYGRLFTYLRDSSKLSSL